MNPRTHVQKLQNSVYVMWTLRKRPTGLTGIELLVDVELGAGNATFGLPALALPDDQNQQKLMR